MRLPLFERVVADSYALPPILTISCNITPVMVEEQILKAQDIALREILDDVQRTFPSFALSGLFRG